MHSAWMILRIPEGYRLHRSNTGTCAPSALRPVNLFSGERKCSGGGTLRRGALQIQHLDFTGIREYFLFARDLVSAIRNNLWTLLN
jgi:hypothetical protein